MANGDGYGLETLFCLPRIIDFSAVEWLIFESIPSRFPKGYRH